MASRAMGNSLQQVLGQPVNVINRTGGGGVIGHLALSQAVPDGYTIGAITGEITMMHWQGLTKLNSTNYTPLALLVNNAAAITVRNDAPWQTLEELIADIKANPGKYQASGTARGGIWDLARIGFLEAIDQPETAVPWVPSKGASPALQELLAGGVDIVTTALTEVQTLYKSGEVRVLGVMSSERLEGFPEIPTLKEQGVEWEVGGWVGLGAPANLPKEVFTYLDSAIAAAVKDPSFTDPLKKSGANIQYLNAADFQQFMDKQDAINGKMLKAAGLAKTP